MSIPDDCKFTKTHEWVRMEGGLAIVGITDHAQQALGDITFVELPTAGTDVERGGEMGVIESVKAASDVYSPLTGQVAEVNKELDDKPELVNESPYELGWIVKLSGVDQQQVAPLMDAGAYRQFVESEA